MTRRKVSANASNEDRLRFHGWDVSSAGCWNWLGYTDNRGYGDMALAGNHHARAHRVAYETWVGPIPEGYSVRHRCDNSMCINPEHLMPGTHADNMQDMAKRLRHGRAKLNPMIVRSIRELYATGNHSQRALAQQFNVSQPNIGYVVRGEIWAHVT